jgi:microcystin-dependent protein
VLSEIPDHEHPLPQGAPAGSVAANPGPRVAAPWTNAGATTTGNFDNSAGGGAAHNNMQPTLILNSIIFAGV